jgi:hypothetical protein
MVKRSENIPARGPSRILKAFKEFRAIMSAGQSMRSQGADMAARGPHFWMATLLLNSDVNGGTVARVSARGHFRRQR